MLEKMSSEKLFFIALAAVLITLILSITYFNLVDNKERYTLLKSGVVQECLVQNSVGRNEIILSKECPK